MDDALEFVKPVRSDREPRVARIGDGLPQIVGGERHRHCNDVESRRHDVTNRCVREVEQGVDDLSLGLFDLSATMTQGRESSDVVLGDSIAIGPSIDTQ